MEVIAEMKALSKTFAAPTLAVVGSHSALDVCSGAKKHGIKNLVICQKGRERPYDFHYRRAAGKYGEFGCVDETLLLGKFSELCSERNISLLRKKQALLVPHRSLCVYVGYDNLESCRLPILGNRFLLRAEERSPLFSQKRDANFADGKMAPHARSALGPSGREKVFKNQLHLLEKANLNVPRQFTPDSIDRLAIVKASEAKRTYERAFFFVSSPEEYERKSKELLDKGIVSKEGLAQAAIEEYIVGVPFNFNFFHSPLRERLELVGIDMRRQTNLDGILRLPADEQLELLKFTKVRNIEIGHVACTIRESMLEAVFDMGERFVAACGKEYPPGIIGPFALQSLISTQDGQEKIYVYDVSFRMPGSPGIKYTPYGAYLYGESMNMGERLALEVRNAIRENNLDKLVT